MPRERLPFLAGEPHAVPEESLTGTRASASLSVVMCGGRKTRWGGALGALAAALALAAPAALAAPPPFLAQSPEDGLAGEAAGQLQLTRGVAADPGREGHVYVVDADNSRISEFTAWGRFVKAWGWEVDKSDPQGELQTCTPLEAEEGTGCRKGAPGSGAGQFDTPEAVAVDGSGMVWVMDIANERVQRFDPAGGPEEDEAVLLKSFGEAGSAEGQLDGSTFAYLNRIAACQAEDSLFVAEGAQERIQRFSSEGSFEGPAIATPGKVRAIATDANCDLYVAFEGEAGVVKIAPTAPYEVLAEFEPEDEAERPSALAVDGAGNLYMALDETYFSEEPKRAGKEPARVQEYDAAGSCLTCGEEGEAELIQGEVEGLLEPKTIRRGFDRSADTQLRDVAASGACDAGGEGENSYLVRFGGGLAFLRAYGLPDPTVCPPPPAPPVVAAQYAASVEANAARIRANINPKFWSGTVGTTNYYAQWGTTACLQAGGWEAGCVEETATPPGPALGGEAVSAPVPTAPVALEGLAPGTSYSYRFVAVSDGGGPTYGEEARFTTYREGAQPPCANDAHRGGAGASLPDCRAYELVSPLDKEGGDIVNLNEITTGLPAIVSKSAASGDRMAYGSYRASDGADSAPYNSQYVAARRAGVGWATHGVSPPAGRSYFSTAKRLDNEVRAFSEDLCTAWVQTFAEPVLAPGAPEGFSGLYRRADEECGGPGYTALNTVTPEGVSVEEFTIEPQGLSADGLTAAFVAKALSGAGGSEEEWQLYGRRGAVERMLCMLPEGGGAIAGPCTAGGTATQAKPSAGRNRRADVQGAVSADGERVFWTATEKGPGPIYVRERPFAEAIECSASGPCSHEVSKQAEDIEESEGSLFQAAAADGSRALFTTDDVLYEYDLEAEESTAVAGEVVGGILGASEDVKRVYFVSREEKAPGAEAGEANLYFHEAGGGDQLIGALEAAADLRLEDMSPVAPQPLFHTARVAASGEQVAFTAVTALTGYDNTDRASGEADAEVYLYDAGAEELVCASCNPSGARPRGVVVQEGNSQLRAAARLPVFQNILYGSRLLSADGRRLFFVAQDGLVPRDTNQREDLYQWEAAGEGGCSAGAPSYSPANGGCVDLISSGQAARDVRFLDASSSGEDVFFATINSLVGWDYGLADVYDARVAGGLPSPPEPGPECEGEACQSPAPAPGYETPGSSTYAGPGNLAAPKRHKAKRCPKHKRKVKRKGKVRCVKNKRHAKRRHARHHRAKRAARKGRGR